VFIYRDYRTKKKETQSQTAAFIMEARARERDRLQQDLKRVRLRI